MPKSKEISIDLRKRIVQGHKTGMVKLLNNIIDASQNPESYKKFQKNEGFVSAPSTGLAMTRK